MLRKTEKGGQEPAEGSENPKTAGTATPSRARVLKGSCDEQSKVTTVPCIEVQRKTQLFAGLTGACSPATRRAVWAEGDVPGLSQLLASVQPPAPSAGGQLSEHIETSAGEWLQETARLLLPVAGLSIRQHGSAVDATSAWKRHGEPSRRTSRLLDQR